MSDKYKIAKAKGDILNIIRDVADKTGIKITVVDVSWVLSRGGWLMSDFRVRMEA